MSEPPGQSGDGMPASSIEAVVLAGGHGWGENPLEQTTCRALIPVAGRPLILHTLDWLRAAGIRRASICVNQEGRQVRRLLGDGSMLGMELNYFEDVMPRGPAGCVKNVSGESDAGRFVVVEGTVLFRLDLGDLLSCSASSVLTLVVSPGRAASQNQHVYEPAGLYVFSRAALAHVPELGYQDIKETLIPRLHVNGERVDTYVVERRCVTSIVGVTRYLSANHQALDRVLEGAEPAGYRRVDGALVHESCRVAADARLIGPVLVEEGAELATGSMVIGPATVGPASKLSSGAVVSRSVLWAGCEVGAGAVVDQAILTDGVRVEASQEVRQTVLVPPRRGRGERDTDCAPDGSNWSGRSKPVSAVRGSEVGGRVGRPPSRSASASGAHASEVKS